jgi:N-acyl-D-amino-acid deacylase
MPASRINLLSRGTLAKGMTADIVIFDPETVDDNEDWAHPHQYATGFSYVIIGGVPAIDAGVRTSKFPGRVLRRGT